MKIEDIVGLWKIEKMEMWDEDYIHMEVQAYIKFDDKKGGEFQFGLVTGYLSGDVYKIGNQERFEFTWEGSDECDEAFGFGWVKIASKGRLEGEFRFHNGDNSSFIATNGLYAERLEIFDIEDQDERVASIIKDKNLSVNSKTLKTYLGFLKENILLPYQVTGSDGYFTYYSPKTKRGDLKGSDKFEIIAFDEDIQNCSNLFVKARRLNSQGGVFSLQLFELEAIDQTTIECKILEDYTYWISHYL